MTSRNIVQKLGRIESSPRMPRYEIPFTLPGELSEAIVSGPWRPRENVVITTVRAYLTTAGAGPTVVTVNISSDGTPGHPISLLDHTGTAVTNITLASGVIAWTGSGQALITPTQTLTVALVSFTAPAEGLTVIVDLG